MWILSVIFFSVFLDLAYDTLGDLFTRVGWLSRRVFGFVFGKQEHLFSHSGSGRGTHIFTSNIEALDTEHRPTVVYYLRRVQVVRPRVTSPGRLDLIQFVALRLSVTVTITACCLGDCETRTSRWYLRCSAAASCHTASRRAAAARVGSCQSSTPGTDLLQFLCYWLHVFLLIISSHLSIYDVPIIIVVVLPPRGATRAVVFVVIHRILVVQPDVGDL